MGFPRTRGDGPKPCELGKDYCSFPPHARGWTCASAARPPGRPVSPARAGMDRVVGGLFGGGGSFPRTRGDGPGTRSVPSRVLRFPPHARGWTGRDRARRAAAGVSPARAGMDPGTRSAACCRGRFPRTRGDGPLSDRSAFDPGSFPPHARGWTCKRTRRAWRRWVSPARAGMDPGRHPPPPAGRRFPRTRGDGPYRGAVDRLPAAFPPHARGWTRFKR